jgi:hypothetical protein
MSAVRSGAWATGLGTTKSNLRPQRDVELRAMRLRFNLVYRISFAGVARQTSDDACCLQGLIDLSRFCIRLIYDEDVPVTD